MWFLSCSKSSWLFQVIQTFWEKPILHPLSKDRAKRLIILYKTGSNSENTSERPANVTFVPKHVAMKSHPNHDYVLLGPESKYEYYGYRRPHEHHMNSTSLCMALKRLDATYVIQSAIVITYSIDLISRLVTLSVPSFSFRPSFASVASSVKHEIVTEYTPGLW